MLKKIKYRLKVLEKLLPFTKGIKRFFFISFLLNIISMVLGFINPLFYKLFINDVILGGHFEKMLIVVSGYLGIFFVGVIIGYIKNYANYTLVNTTLYRAKFKIWQNFLKMPFQDYETASIGDMKMRLDDDTGQIGNYAGQQTINYLISYITLIGSLLLMFIIDWRLALFSISVIPLTFWLDHILSKRESVLNNTNRENDQKMSSWLHASIQGWREIKALNLDNSQEQKFMQYLNHYALYYWKWVNYWAARVLVIPKIKDQFFMQFGLYFIGGLLIINSNLKISNLLIFSMYFDMLFNAVKTVSSTDADLQSNMPFTDRLLSELDRKENTEIKNGVIPDDTNTILLDNVCFTYPNAENEVLHNFNLTINKGERVAITGKSGSGKTTILKLITGMIAPTRGSVCFAAVNLNEIDLPAMHSRIGFVMQENMLFNTTIRENLLYGKNDATDEEFFEACKKAYIYDFIVNLPNGLDTIIGEKGIKLSGGQRQRIVLARLFLRDVDIFIFDEATNALDQYSENIVHNAIRNIAEDKTIIVVAHRESSIRLCDRKIVM
ncbi:MAG: ABC transporter ATP-binding protein/permease [Clostridia bacterium]|nr:ABC transporter ATP-binding protein/permease [Clostridia bacterium]